MDTNKIFHLYDNSGKIRDSFFLATLCAMTFILVFSFCWQPGYLDDDSISYALTAKHVRDSNQWLAFKDAIYGGPFYYHFPLVIWVTALIFKLFGVNVVSASIFSLLSCLTAVIALFYFGKFIKNNWVGFFASAVFLLINYTPRLARQCRMDMPLTLFIILSLYFFLRAVKGKAPLYLLFGLFASLAIMAKDVNGLAPLAIAVIYLLFTRQFRTFLNPYFLAAIVLSFVPALLWMRLELHFYAETTFSKWLNWNFLHLLRHEALQKPFYYYPREIIKRYPYFVPLFIYGGFLAVRQALRKQSDAPLLILIWAVFIPFAFSFGSQKLHYFIYSMYPAQALLAGIGLDNLCKEAVKQRILSFFIIGLILTGLFKLCTPLQFGKTFFMDTVRLAPHIDSVLREETDDFGFFTFNQHDSALVFYCRQLENTTPLKDYETLTLKLEKKAGEEKRFFLLNREDFNSLTPTIKKRYDVLLNFENRILIN